MITGLPYLLKKLSWKRNEIGYDRKGPKQVNRLLMRKLLILVIGLLPITSSTLLAQRLALGVTASPLILAKPAVSNPSPLYLSGDRKLGFEGGVFVSKYFNERIGVKIGFGTGIVDWNIIVDEQPNANGLAVSGFVFDIENYTYNALDFSLLYKFKLRDKDFIEVAAGPSLRFYRL